jgi:hypothetical protein
LPLNERSISAERCDDGNVANWWRPRATKAGDAANGSDTPAGTTAVDAPTTELRSDASLGPEPIAAPAAPTAPTARATFSALAASIASALAALTAAILTAAPRAALLAKVGLVRLTEFRPSPLLTLAMLGGAAAFGVVGALALPNSAVGQACAVVLVPGLSIAIGVLANRWYTTHVPDQQSATTTRTLKAYLPLQLERSVRFVDDRLAAAQGHLQNGDSFGALIEVVRAKTATELGTEPSRQAASVAPPEHELLNDDDDETRPRIREGNTPRIAQARGEAMPLAPLAISIGAHEGSVARVEDQYTLIINRGSEHDVKPDMVFAVMARRKDSIIDPENGEVIGELPVEKLRVKVFDVQPKYSWAETFPAFAPLSSAHVEPPEVTVDIGDRIRHVALEARPGRPG